MSLQMAVAIFVLLICAPAAWACPSCTEKSVMTPQMGIAAHALAIWTTAFVLGWYGSAKTSTARMLRLVVAAGFLAGAMPVATLWINSLLPAPVFLPFYLPLSWGTIIGFPVLLVMASKRRKEDVESPFPCTVKHNLLGLGLGVLAVQTMPIVNELIQGPRISYGREFGDPSSVVLLLFRPLPLVLLVLAYWWRNRNQSQHLMMSMLVVLAVLSMWLSFPLRELNGYAWFAESGMEEASAFSGNLLRLFRFTVPVLSLIPLLYVALCKRYHERLGLDRKTLRVLFGVGVIAGGLALVASVDELKRDLKTERMNRVQTGDVRLAIRLNQKDGDIEQVDRGQPRQRPLPAFAD